MAADGGRLKLEWGVLRTRAGRDVDDLLWWQDDRLLGFLGLYAFAPPDLEIAGMVDPSARRRGIATTLLEAALPIARARGYARALLVTPRGSDAGHAFALNRGAVLEHSEHALVLLNAPAGGSSDARLTLRAATSADSSEIARLLAAAFGTPFSDLPSVPVESPEQIFIAEFEGLAVGTVRVARDGDTAGIYGFAVDPAWQRRGIGRDVLRRLCRQLRDEGIGPIGLEVAVDNERALGLYTSLGFTQITSEDYYALAVGPQVKR